ncbi:ephrin type-A receptor 1 isoform X3 [Calypte anna]|uniref:ephrin type-A receptor 1 isoform X3 n=1 Tax=Calypte anna TaxID=9244 RepID=UPI0011C430BD|nr:ephrin type-A receptor 1 isoform X3 [Calypte anna]
MELRTWSSGISLRLLLFWALLPPEVPGKEVDLLDTSTAQGELGWLPDPPEVGWSEVQQMINGTPVYMYQDCSVLSEGDTDHWLRTNWIYRGEAASRIYVELKFTVRDCKSFKGEVVTCKETFNLYYMESEQDVGIQFRRPLFIKLNTVAADQSFTSRDIESGAMQLNTEVCPIGKLSRRGFYLAFQNSGACVALVSVRVYYKTCPEAVRGLAHFPETLAGSEGLTEVPGVCVEYAAEEVGSPPRMHCSTDGEWLVPMGRCLCAVGFEEADGSCVACQRGFYRHSLETKHCLKCPPNSLSNESGATSCPCNAGFYRAPAEGQNIACTRPPSAPRNVSFSLIGTQLSLWWQPPSDHGGRKDLTYTVFCHRCHFLLCDPCEAGVVFSPRASGLTKPAVDVDGLEAYTNYTFAVEAHNGVSGMGPAPQRTSPAVWVSVGHAAPVTVSQFILTQRDDSSLSVSWLAPQQRSRTSVEYEVMFFEKGEEARYTVKHLLEPNVTLTDLQPDTAYLLRVRSITPLGPGPYSPEQEFRTLPPDTGALSGGVIVSIIFGVLLFIGLLLGLFIFRRKQARRRQARPDYNTSGFDREKVWLKPYVDLQPYDDPSRGVLEFTKELDVTCVTMENVIGEGEFGEVYRGSLRLPGKERVVVAIKTLKSTYSDSQWWNFLREATIMGQFNHPNIVRLEGVVTKRRPMMIITEYMENGALDTFLRGGKIPIRWTAPEAIAHRIFTSASDVWSFGIVMWEVLSFGDKPYGNMTNQEVMKSLEDGYRLPPPVDCPSILYELMKSCWSHDRTRRPHFQEIRAQLQHFISSPQLLRPVADFDPRVTLRLPSCSGSDGIPYRSIPEWLESIRMKRYISNFRTAGLDTMESILELTAEDLKQMGVSLPGHQKRILCSIQGFKE